jgi:hypothetical protein
MSAMRTGLLLGIMLTSALSAPVKPSSVQRLGTVIGRVIGPGPHGRGLADVTVRLRSNGTQCESLQTDSTGTFTFTAAGRGWPPYDIRVEPTGYDQAWADLKILPDSLTRLPVIILWPTTYFDWAAYREFMAASSITLHAEPLPRTNRVEHKDSTLLVVYRNHLSRARKLVLRANISPPWDSSFPGGWDSVKEYGRCLLVDKNRCQFMDVRMWCPVSGMRLVDVDSIKFGSYTKGGFEKCSVDALREYNWWCGLCLKLYLHPYGTAFIDSRGNADSEYCGQ